MKNRYFQKIFARIIVIFLSFFVISCASGPGGDEEVEFVSLSAGSESIVADGATGTLITATVQNTNGENAEGTTVTFTTTAGTLSAHSARTVNGVATVTLTSPTNVGSASIIATSGGVNSSATVNFIPGPVTNVKLTATPNNLTADGASESTIRAEVTDANNNAVDGETISFFVTTGSGTLSMPTATTSGGVATTTYTASDTPGVEEIRAEATNGTFSTAIINLIAAFVGSVELTAGCDTIPADGITGTQISATIKDTNGNNVPDGTTVDFSATAGRLSAPSAPTTNGVAVVTITSSTNVGTATIIATSGGVNGITSVSFIPGAVMNVVLTATPNNLSSDGTSTSTIRAEVTDRYKNAVADGETISFSITTGTGTLSAPTATTTGGVATVTYTASHTAGIETVTAETANGSSSTANITLITASIGSVEVNAGSEEVVADGASGTQIRAYVNDTNGDKIADGTPVSFTTTAGSLSAPTATTTNGIATVTLTSPTNVGSASIIATSGGVNGNTTVNFIPGPVTNIILTAVPNNLSADGTSTSTIRAEVTDAQGNAVDGETISFSVTTGTGILSEPTATTTGGVATVTYTASTAPGAEVIRAETTNGVFSTATITLIAASIGSVEVNAGSEEVVADGVSGTIITATVKDTNGNNVPNGTSVSFTTTAGSISATSATTTNGIATVTLTSPTNVGSASIIATSGGVNGSATVNFIPGTVTNVALTATPNNLTADGTSTSIIRAEVTDAQGNAMDGETISFSVTTGTGTLSEPTATTSGGVATVTYSASNNPGSEIIRAEATNGAFSTVTINLITASVGSVDLTAGCDTIPADGTSSTLITATVKDTNDNNVPDGTLVNFTTTAGNLSATSATTTNGIATINITSSTNLGAATIIATSGGVNANITVEFIAGSVTTVTLTATPNNLTADGTSTSTIRADVADAQGNAVDGETISFSVTTGTGTLSAPTATTSGGVATVTYTASTTAGVVTITAESLNGITNHVDITVAPGENSGSIDVTANPDTIVADGSSTSLLTATLQDNNGDPIVGAPVSFSKIYHPLPTENTYSGTGTKLTSPFYCKGGITTFTMGHDGESNFIVWLWNKQTGREALLVNEIGDVKNYETIEDLNPGDYLLEVFADGNWTIKVEGEIVAVPGEVIGKSLTNQSGNAYFTYNSTIFKGFFDIFALSGTLACNVTITQTAGPAANIQLSAEPASIYANGEEISRVTAAVMDMNNNPVEDGMTVAFSSTQGSIDASATTSGGIATAELLSIPSNTTITSTVTASIAGYSDITEVEFKGVALFLAATNTTGKAADGEDKYTIIAQLLDASGQPVSGKEINFSNTGNTGLVVIDPVVSETGPDGTTSCTVTDISATQDLVIIDASFGGITAVSPIGLSFTGTGGGATVGSVILAATATTGAIADGTDSYTITAQVLDPSGQPINNQGVTFSSTGNTGLVAINPPVTTTTDDGTATCSVTDISAENDTANITASSGGEISLPMVLHFAAPTGQTVPASFSLSTSQISVKSDNSDSATITATVLDDKNAVIEGIIVGFMADGGQLSSSSAATDSNGQAQVIFSSGSVDRSNKVVTIEASVIGLPNRQIPIQILGSTLTISAGNTTITEDGSTTADLTIEAKDAGGNPVYNTPIALSMTGSGGATLSEYSGFTDLSGKFNVTLTGTAAGTVTVQADGLGATAAQDFEVISAGGVFFEITNPTTDPVSLGTGDDLTVTVSAPAPTTKVVFSTSFGVWDGGASNVVTKDVSLGTASAVFSSALAGVATLQVHDEADVSRRDSVNVAVSAPSADAAYITLQSNTNVVPLSVGVIKNTATLTASVRTSSASGQQPVGGAAVIFSIEDQTGGGETIFPVISYTDASGIATTTFASGSLSSGAEGVVIKARVLGKGTTGELASISFNNSNPDTITRSDIGSFIIDGFKEGEQIRVQGSQHNDGYYIINQVADDTLTLDPGDNLTGEAEGKSITITAVTTSVNIVIGGTAGSIVIGRGSEIEVLSPTTYSLPMSVLVADSNGNPVAGAAVSLNAWPSYYSTGYWGPIFEGSNHCKYYLTGTYENEDANENLFLDPGEDYGTDPGNGDGQLTPPNSAAGTIPMTVTTDNNGVASFNLVYMKSSAIWITDRIRASTLVMGTETTSSMTFRLPAEKDEAWECKLPESPYNKELPVGHINLTSEENSLTADGLSTSAISAVVTDTEGKPVSGEVVTLEVTTGTGTLSAPAATTDSNGVISVTYTASTTPGTETITAKANGISATVDIVLVSPLIGSLELTAGCDTIPADGTTITIITATVKDTNGNNVPDGARVDFTTTAGELVDENGIPVSPPIVTTTNGIATIYIKSSTNLGTATIIATSGGVNADVTVEFVAGPVAEIALTAIPNNLTADGTSTSTIRALVTDDHGNAVNGETITFTMTAGTGTLSSQTATTTNGIATVTYTASTQIGTETVKAEATNSAIFNTVDIELIDVVIGTVSVSPGSDTAVADGSSQTLITCLGVINRYIR